MVYEISEALKATLGTHVQVKRGERFSFLIIGNEVRAYRNYAPGVQPLAVMLLAPDRCR